MELLTLFEPWQWFVLAAALFVMEVLVTVGFFIGIALASLILSVLTYMSPEMGWQSQMVVFGGLSVALTWAYKKYFRGFNEATDSPLLNDRAAQMVGTKLVLEEDIDGSGALMIHDIRWHVECEGKLDAGTAVTVADSRGMTLLLQKQ